MLRSFRTAAVLATAVGAIAAPTASGRPARDPAPATPERPIQIVHVTDHPGFDWGDAGIGAAGGFAISILCVGGALAVLELRTRRTGSARPSATDPPARGQQAEACDDQPVPAHAGH